MTNTTTVGGLTLFVPQYPIIISKSNLYNPTVSPPTGTTIPIVNCIVVDPTQNNALFIVTAVDPTTYASTLTPVTMVVDNTDPNQSQTSIISYGNDIFRLYVDPRTTPFTATPDARIVAFGGNNTTYRIVQNPGSSQIVLSANYNSSGNYTGVLAPMIDVPIPTITGGLAYSYTGTARSCAPCYVTQTLTDGEELFIQVFNSQGAQTATISVFVQTSIILNEAITPDPVITDITITSNQSRSNGEIYIYQGQNANSLGIQVTLTYSDGHQRNAPIDSQQTFLYGLTDFIASYPGLQQGIIAKYFLSSSEQVSGSLAANSATYISAEATLVVISNQLQYGVKISVIPRWNATLARGSLYGVAQNLTLQLDMSLVDPTTYSVSTLYQQTSIITLQPIAAYVRYILQDATNATVIYGPDTTGNRRPVVHYDATLQQYYIPAIFPTQTAFLQSFFYDGNPLYNTVSETAPPVPTHFVFRDPASGQMLVAAPIPLAQYTAAVSIIGTGSANRYAGTGSNILVEFMTILGGSNPSLILYGTPADVVTAVYNQ
ncbi:unnamed protein product [Sphagnum jensenii]|uniref:Uncharacterized protein n=1 Tax=Sphagnum jensenii TaxID=128206 RepID=A0ABP0VIB9_9BRYO